MTAAGFQSELKPKAWQVLAGDSAAGRLQDSAVPELTATHQAPGRPSRFTESFTCNHCACTPLSFQHAKLKYRRVGFCFFLLKSQELVSADLIPPNIQTKYSLTILTIPLGKLAKSDSNVQ